MEARPTERARLTDRVRALLPATGSVTAYLVAIFIIMIAVLVRFPLDEITDDPLPPFLTLYPAIVIASFTGGIRVGLFTIIASALCAWVFWMGPPSPTMGAGRIAAGLVYLLTSIITVLAAGSARLLFDQAAAGEAMRAREARESVHRIKNLLAIVQAISRKISETAEDVGAYRAGMDARLQALATAQDVLLKRDWDDVPVNQLVQSSLGPFIPNPRLELRVDVDANAPKEAITGLSMALHELATNSMKYGALVSPNGYVRLEARVLDGRCCLEWREIGLAQVAMGEGAGLGVSLIRSALGPIEEGTVLYDISPQAVSCVFDWPLPKRA